MQTCNDSKLTWYLTSQCHHLCSYAKLDKQIWRSRITIPTKLKLYNTCILPIFLYGSECWAVTKRYVLKIDALDQWCLRKLLGIKWYHHMRNDEVRRTTGQPRLSAIVQARRLSLFGHIARMPDETDAKSIITASPSENWRRPPGRPPRTTWMKTIQEDLRSNNLSLDEAITVAQNRQLWRLMSAFGATHPQWGMPHKKKKKKKRVQNHR